jgi:glyoxylase-like metal-dependent hydrolase (beta-lactamase superfamily II)
MAEIRSFGRVKVIIGEKNGKYPHGNSILIEDDVTALIDPSQTVYELHGRVTERTVDLLLNSHYHEDHWIGNHWFPRTPLYMHALDMPAMRSLDTLFDYYGMDEAANAVWKPVLLDKYHYQPRQQIGEFQDGQVFDFGHTRMRVIHTPGHTGGHCCFFFENESLLFLADWDLTRFGPVYGDATSDLIATIRSLEQIRALGAQTLVSFHHVGICETNQAALVTRYLDIVYEREQLLLEFLAEPRTLEEVVKKRIIYRKDYADVVWVDAVERNSMRLHLQKLVDEGRIAVTDGHYLRQ